MGRSTTDTHLLYIQWSKQITPLIPQAGRPGNIPHSVKYLVVTGKWRAEIPLLLWRNAKSHMADEVVWADTPLAMHFVSVHVSNVLLYEYCPSVWCGPVAAAVCGERWYVECKVFLLIDRMVNVFCAAPPCFFWLCGWDRQATRKYSLQV